MGININAMKFLGLMLSNALIDPGRAMFTQYQGFVMYRRVKVRLLLEMRLLSLAKKFSDLKRLDFSYLHA